MFIYYNNINLKPEDIINAQFKKIHKVKKDIYNIKIEFDVLNKEERYKGNFQINFLKKTILFSIIDEKNLIIINKTEKIKQFIYYTLKSHRLRLITKKFPYNMFIEVFEVNLD